MSLWKILGTAEDEKGAHAVPTEASSAPTAPPPIAPSPRIRVQEGGGAQLANIGKSISIKGDVIGDEDTVIEGRVEGRIELKNHHLTVGPNGDVAGEIGAKQVTIVGRVTGNVTAAERVEVCDSGRIDGDIIAPRLLVQEGAQLNGSVTMKPVTLGSQPAKKLDDRRSVGSSRQPEAQI